MVRVDLKTPVDEVNAFFTEIVGDFVGTLDDLFLGLFGVWVFERSGADNEFICQDAKAPYVNSVVVCRVMGLQHFWRQVVACTAKGVAAL